MKALIVEDNPEFVELFGRLFMRIYGLELELLNFWTQLEASEAIAGEHSDFDLLLLDGNLGAGGHGREILRTLDPRQKSRTVVISAEAKFESEAKELGITLMDKSFDGMLSSEIEEHVREVINEVLDRQFA